MPRTRFANCRVKAAVFWPALTICAVSVVMVVACAKPRGEGYRRVELFSAGNRQIEFEYLLEFESHDTFVGTTPRQIELDLDTMGWCMGGPRCRILRVSPASDRLWVWAFDRESLRLDKYLASPSDVVDFDLQSWFCYQGKP